MKLVIEVKEEDYKRYKEDKICSYTSAVLDAVPLNEVLYMIRAEMVGQKECHCFDDDDMFAYMTGLNDAIDIIDKYRKGK